MGSKARKNTEAPAKKKIGKKALKKAAKREKKAKAQSTGHLETPPKAARAALHDNEPTPTFAPVPPAAEAALGSGAEPDSEKPTLPDFDKLAANLSELLTHGSRIFASYLQPATQVEKAQETSKEITLVVQTLGRVAEHWLSDPARSLEAQRELSSTFLGLWAQTLRRFSGEAAPPVVPPDPADKRFAAPEWSANPLFDFLRQAHAILTGWSDDLAARAESLDDHTRSKARFYLRQISSALSPSNFLMTNPELLRETFSSNAENLLRGLGLLVEDIEAGGGQLKIRQTDASKFKLGVNMAATTGKVVFRNDLLELIQYTPTTETVCKRPLLIVPPWINKFYILDLNNEKSFVRFAVAQDHTVFMISWVNPDARHRDKDWSAYIHEGLCAALDAIEAATGEREVNAIGYCVGGTLLSAALASMAQSGDDRIKSATLFAAQTDFSQAGDLKVFIDEEQIAALEAKMKETGYLDASTMANAFNLLRPNDLIWAYVVNNYLKGQRPAAFDLLAWNSDATRIPAASHAFYLRACYLENALAKGMMIIDGKKLSLADIKIPIYSLAAKEDHIAPAESVFLGAKLYGGPVRFVLAGSGHIAGVINPPAKVKYQYWTGEPCGSFKEWLAGATKRPGSWWPDWSAWILERSPETVRARWPGDGALQPLCDAPGDYVRVIA